MNGIVLKFSQLAKLTPSDCSESDIEKYTSFFKKEDFSAVLKMIHSIQKINTDGIPHHFLFFDDQMNGIENCVNARNDEVKMNNTRDDLLSNARSKMGYYVVPKVIGDQAE
jgi:aspartyl/glutamyl-tRNA(Asn/Gln) amidotransferase C subunit